MDKYDRIIKTCISIYNKAKKKRPLKADRDYLKLVLLTKPPWDYALDPVIEYILNEHGRDIHALAEFIADMQTGERKRGELPSGFEERRRNLKQSGKKMKERNKRFFKDFWWKFGGDDLR